MRRRQAPPGEPQRAVRLTDNPCRRRTTPPRIGDALVMRRGHCPGFARPRSIPPATRSPFRNRQPSRARETARARSGAGRAAPAPARSRHRPRCGGTAAIRHGRIVTGRFGHPRRLAQKRGLALVGFDQLDPGHAEDRQHQPGKPGAAAEIDQALRVARDKRQELRRIEDMAAPQIAERVAADQVDARRPAGQQST